LSFDPVEVRALLIAAARAGAPVTYAEAMAAFGHRFSRPMMRQFCKALDAVDERCRAAGEPELAVLVVRQSDGLPGQGWWAAERGYAGPWKGPEARAHVAALQRAAFARWAGGEASPPP
jgi:hypothetical protein